MKKNVLLGMLSVLLVFASCKSASESAYKQAYEKAKGQETAPVQVNTPVQVTPVETSTATSDYEDAPVRKEQVTAVSVNGDLKPYSVVCGSFSLQTNADALKNYLTGEGYKAGIVKNVEKNMFRVIIGSYNTKAEAASAREAFKTAYPKRTDFQGSWILLNQ